MSEEYYTIVVLEDHIVFNHEVVLDTLSGSITISDLSSSWDPRPHIEADKPNRLFDELARQLESHWSSTSVITHRKTDEPNKNVVISLPGTLDSDTSIKSSSRLKIYSGFNVTEFMSKRQIKCSLAHDVEALAWGELEFSTALASGQEIPSLALVLIDEGVGSKFIVDGKTYNGAGVAGTISRLVVQPEGAFFPKLKSRGNLEVFASRPWISQTIIENFNSLCEKTKSEEDNSQQFSDFERKLAGLSKHEKYWSSLSFEDMCIGVKVGHPSCLKAITLAEKYVGRTLHNLMVILNPHEIVLGGGAIEHIPNFYENVVEIARDYSWPNCWNNTSLRRSSTGRTSQVTGAMILEKRQYE